MRIAFRRKSTMFERCRALQAVVLEDDWKVDDNVCCGCRRSSLRQPWSLCIRASARLRGTTGTGRLWPVSRSKFWETRGRGGESSRVGPRSPKSMNSRRPRSSSTPTPIYLGSQPATVPQPPWPAQQVTNMWPRSWDKTLQNANLTQPRSSRRAHSRREGIASVTEGRMG
jgi:hypothetical protein